MFTQIIFALIFIVSILQLLALKGSHKDRIICTFLRLAFLTGVTVLWFSPRFEDVTRNLELPHFALLEDQSLSVRSLSEDYTKHKSSLSEFLGQWGTLRNVSFPNQALAYPADSITANLNALCLEKNYRAIFLVTDGQESHQGTELQCNTPIFILPSTAPQDLTDSGIEPIDIPIKSYLGQEISIRTRVYSNTTGKLNIRLHLNQSEIASREINASLAGETVEFKIILNQSGVQNLGLEVSSSANKEATLLNNTLNWTVTVQEKNHQILVLAQAPSFELSQFLQLLSKIPSLRFVVHYPKLHPELQAGDYHSLILWGGLDTFSMFPSLKNLPVLVVLDPKTSPSQIWPEKLRSSLVTASPLNGDLKVHHTEFLSQLEGIGSVLETLRPPAPAFVPAQQTVIQSILSLEDQNKSIPLVFMLPDTSQTIWVVTHPEIITMDFFPSARSIHQEFVTKLFTFLISSLISKNLNDGIRIVNLPQIMMEGERLNAEFSSQAPVSVTLTDKSKNSIWSSSLPVTMNKVLDQGLYQFRFSGPNSQILREEQLLVGIPFKEMASLGNSIDWMRNTVGNKGQILEPDKNFLHQIPAEILQKQLRMQKRTIDLQANWIWLVLLVTAISLEWFYRFMQRMV
ncbi:MAG: hypothetical protein H3C47_05590 [Candidatus Cloacimonetes bacterium]|nr:hypothetical protein [Candidatus Cloacimonadota bacterium]